MAREKLILPTGGLQSRKRSKDTNQVPPEKMDSGDPLRNQIRSRWREAVDTLFDVLSDPSTPSSTRASIAMALLARGFGRPVSEFQVEERDAKIAKDKSASIDLIAKMRETLWRVAEKQGVSDPESVLSEKFKAGFTPDGDG